MIANHKEAVSIRNYNVTPQLPSNGITVAEMYAGGGLMAVGLKAAGYDLIWANDFDKRACTAYEHNIGPIVHGDITQIDLGDIPDADVFAGGPPCQDYSVAGTGAGADGERGKLVWDYLAKIERKRPKAFVFENVKGLVSKRHRQTFDALVQRFEDAGYNVSWRVINAWDYGVAQKRERVFIVGIRKDLEFTFEFPEPLPEDYRTQVLRDVIGDLPEPIDSVGRNVKVAEHRADMNDPAPVITTQFRCQSVEITNHDGGIPTREYPGHTASDIDSPAKTIVAGANGVPGGANCFYPNSPQNHIQTPSTTVKPTDKLSNQRRYVADWETPARTVNTSRLDHAEIHPGLQNHDEKSYWTPNREYSYDQANRVQSMDSASNTIPAHHNSGQPIHPTQQPRRFTVRECLRIQSVPDWYVLPDGLSLSAQYRIVGNGVASRVAYLIGVALAEQLRKTTDLQEAV